MKTTKYNDGTAIPNVTDNSTWNALSSPAYCAYNNTKNTDTINTYGLLYNWYTVNTNKLCPIGFHVPSDSEWHTLILLLDTGTQLINGAESSFAGGKLKEVGTAHWSSPNLGAENSKFFSALPSGNRRELTYEGISNAALFWSRIEYDAGNAWYRILGSTDAIVYRSYNYKFYGYSVRCLQDCQPPTTSQAGSDRLNLTSTSTTLSANVPLSGTGQWSIATGTGCIIIDSSKNNSTITGIAGNSYKLVWTITNGCAEKSMDTVVVSFKAIVTGITDIDDNGYDTIRIGTQVWFKQNLKTTKYNDGTIIPNVTDNAAWSANTTGARCYYNNDSLTYANTYGALYNWYAVNTNKLCPMGYHVPTDAEWSVLNTYLGGDLIAGGRLKEIGGYHWLSPNTGAEDNYGFTALPGGYRYGSSGLFNAISHFGLWWSATENYIGSAFERAMYNDQPNLGVGYTNSGNGNSIRCLGDF